MADPLSSSPDPSRINAARNVAMVVFNVTPFLLVFLQGLLSKGRKGHMLTRRAVFHDDALPEEIFQIYAERLEFEGFLLVEKETDRPRQIVAERTPDRQPGVFAHAGIPLEIKILFADKNQGLEVQVEMKTKSLIILDTGEGRYIDETLDRLLGADLQQDAKPLVPNITLTALVALYISILMLVAPLLMLLPDLGLAHALGMVKAMGAECFVCVGLSLIALFLCHSKPKEITGKPQALAGIGLSILAFFLSIGLFILVHGPAALKYLVD